MAVVLLGERDKLIAALRADAVDRVFKADVAKHPLGELLATSGLSLPAQRRFVDKGLAHEGPAPAFWESLREDQEVGAEGIETLQFTLRAALLGGTTCRL